MRRSKRNEMPIAPLNLRITGPKRHEDLVAQFGPFRYAHGIGADTRATIDADPCPHCKAKVEWALTYKKEHGIAVAYIYARCRSASKTHRWDFTHWVADSVTHTPPRHPGPRPTPNDRLPVARPSAGTQAVTNWIDKRLDVLKAELEKLSTIRQLTGEIAGMEERKPMPPIDSPKPNYPGGTDHTPPAAR